MRALWRARILYLLPAISLLCSGCIFGKEAAPAAERWLPKATRFIEDFRGGTTAEHVRIDPPRRSQVDELWRTRPSKPTTEEVATLRQVTAWHDFYSAVSYTTAQTDGRLVFEENHLEAIALDSISNSAPRYSEILSALTEHGAAILKDTVCGLAYKAMRKAEQAKADALYGDGWTRSVQSLVKGLGVMTKEAAVEAIAGDIRKTLLRLVLPADFVAWGLYANGLYKKAQQVTADHYTTVTYPQGGYMTRGFIYYVEKCMLPPKTK